MEKLHWQYRKVEKWWLESQSFGLELDFEETIRPTCELQGNYLWRFTSKEPLLVLRGHTLDTFTFQTANFHISIIVYSEEQLLV